MTFDSFERQSASFASFTSIDRALLISQTTAAVSFMASAKRGVRESVCVRERASERERENVLERVLREDEITEYAEHPRQLIKYNFASIRR